MNYLTDEIGAAQAAKYKLTDEYWMARKHGVNIKIWIFESSL